MLGNPFAAEGRWYKSALHIHTTDSDGARSAEQSVRFYAERGFDLVCISDHHASVSLPETRDDVLLFHAAEVSLPRSCHFVVLGLEQPGRHEGEQAVSDLLDRAKAGEIALFLAHPNWSRMVSSEIMNIEGISAVEVYNTTCDLNRARGLADVHIDDCLDRGRCLWYLAVDDTHYMPRDTGRGFTMLKLCEPTRRAFIEAIQNGWFYASTGVAIHQLAFEEGGIRIVCDPVQRIDFLTGKANRGRCFFATDEGYFLTEATYELPETCSDWVRVQCVAPDGRRAWTNAFKFENGRIVDWPIKPYEWRKPT